MTEKKSDDGKRKLRNLHRRIKRLTKHYDDILRASGQDPEKFRARRRADSEKLAQEYGMTLVELSIFMSAQKEAERTAKPDETVQQTAARAANIWYNEVEKQKSAMDGLRESIMKEPDERKRKRMMNEFRKLDRDYTR